MPSEASAHALAPARSHRPCHYTTLADSVVVSGMELIYVLKHVRDPPDPRGRRFQSFSILSISILATLSGANSLRAIADLAKSLSRRELHILEIKGSKAPSESAIRKFLPRVFGITSLSSEQADSSKLLQLNRCHWSIESKSHYVRDVTLNEDRCRVRTVSSLSTECAAIIDICKKLELGNSALWSEGRLTLLSIVSMLVKLVKTMNGKGPGQGQRQGHPLR